MQPSPQAIAAPGFDPYADARSDTALFGGLAKAVKKAGRAVTHTASKAGKTAVHAAQSAARSRVAKIAVPIAQQQLRKSGPWGIAAAGGLGAMQAGLQGKNLKGIGSAAVTGAMPEEGQRALRAAEALRRGEPVLKVALQNAHSSFRPGSAEALGFASAVRAVHQGGGRAELGEVRRALPNEGSRRAFDAGIGTLARYVREVPHARHLGIDQPMAPKPGRMPLNADLRRATARLRRDPQMMGAPVGVLSRRFGLDTPVLERALQKSGRVFRWRGMSPGAARFVRSRAPQAPMFALMGRRFSDTRGLDASGTVYVVESGDSLSKIAKSLVGDANRWRELYAIPSNKKTIGKDPNKIHPGQSLILPEDWVTPTAPTATPVPSVPGIPSAPPAPASTGPTGTRRIYRVVSGDSLSKIAGKFTGDTNRWRELLVVNPHKKANPDRLDVGEILAIPDDWPDAPGATPVPGPTAPSPPNPEEATTASILQAKATLVAWSASDGVSEPGVRGYGTAAADLSTTWAERDRFVGQSYEAWHNRTGRTPKLTIDGAPNQELFDALRAWAEQRSQGVPGGTLPGATPPTTTPTTSPGVPQIPTTLPTPELPGATPSATPTSATPSAAPKKKDDTLPLIVAGGLTVAAYALDLF